MNNEELNASIQSYLNQNKHLVQPKEEKRPEALEPNIHDDTSGSWIHIFFWAFPISIITVALGPLGAGIGVVIGMLLVNKWVKEGEEIIRKETEAKEREREMRKPKKKILFGQEDQL